MIVFLNGQFVPEAEATVSVFDRSFLYGDGLFETMRVIRGKPFRWWEHMERLRKGGDFLGIKIPFACKALEKFATELIAKNQMPDALLRLTISRGVGVRGYSPRGANQPVVVMTLHAFAGAPASGPAAWKLMTASLRLPAGEKLAQFKTANKLAQVLARAEADAAGADEALLCNTDGFVVEGASSNLCWIAAGKIYTPPLASGILPGVTRAIITELCGQLNVALVESQITPAQLRQADGVFVTLSSFGVVEGVALDGSALACSPLVAQLHEGYEDLLSKE